MSGGWLTGKRVGFGIPSPARRAIPRRSLLKNELCKKSIEACFAKLAAGKTPAAIFKKAAKLEDAFAQQRSRHSTHFVDASSRF
jgi:hypothetical protein